MQKPKVTTPGSPPFKSMTRQDALLSLEEVAQALADASSEIGVGLTVESCAELASRIRAALDSLRGEREFVAASRAIVDDIGVLLSSGENGANPMLAHTPITEPLYRRLSAFYATGRALRENEGAKDG